MDAKTKKVRLGVKADERFHEWLLEKYEGRDDPENFYKERFIGDYFQQLAREDELSKAVSKEVVLSKLELADRAAEMEELAASLEAEIEQLKKRGRAWKFGFFGVLGLLLFLLFAFLSKIGKLRRQL